MLRTYGPDCDGSLIDPDQGGIPAGATWIDLEAPTREEEHLVESTLGLNVPTREEMAEIEPSSRLYEEGGALYMTLSVLFGIEQDNPAIVPITFVLTKSHLVTVRYDSPKPVRLFAEHVSRDPGLASGSAATLVRLLDAIIDRLADELEGAAEEIESISAFIFRRQDAQARRIPPNRLETLLVRIGRVQSLLAKIRETAASNGRLVGFLSVAGRIRAEDDLSEHTRSLAADISSLIDHSSFLSGNVAFLLNASLGLISVEQNAIIKIFSIAAVIFLPPTLVGTVYGMNFDHMPELNWLYGYPFAMGLMVGSAILPYWFFRRRGWL